MTGAEYIAAFLATVNSKKVFLVTGGACAFIVDAIARNEELEYYPFQHEQAAAMAADAVYKITGDVGVTVATSGPGATNLITGIACSYFDSIPSLHITGQVNQMEKEIYKGADVRQAGFQETKIVEMAKPITKYAVQVTNTDELREELAKAYKLATSGRMGPVLIDVPMDVQQAEMPDEVFLEADDEADFSSRDLAQKITSFFAGTNRPLVLLGGGVGLAGQAHTAQSFIEKFDLPFVSSWHGASFVDHSHSNYLGSIGVYGNRGANFALQSCDALLVLGSRLDNRQRGKVEEFARGAKVLVVDIDQGELDKHLNNRNHEMIHIDLRTLEQEFEKEFPTIEPINAAWLSYWKEIKDKYFGVCISTSAEHYNSLSPYDVVKKINNLIQDDAIVTVDDGANLCWVYQAFERTNQTIFTAGGNSPMGYSFPAGIGAALLGTGRQVISFTGDGSIQMNIQDLQSMKNFDLPIKLFVLNNFGYGIIKQFQDTWFDGRYEATGNGYSQPDFEKVVKAYGLEYRRIESCEDLVLADLESSAGCVFDVILHPNTLIEPKIDSGNPLHKMSPQLELSHDAFEYQFLSDRL